MIRSPDAPTDVAERDWWTTNAPRAGATSSSSTFTAPTYDFDHTDENGVHVFKGNDGQYYYESLTGENGFEYLPYGGAGTATNPAQQPTAAPDAPTPGASGGGGGGGGQPTGGFGGQPPPYQSDPNAPDYQPLAPYVPPTWTGGDYVAPTEADLLASPGYGARMDRLLTGKARQYAAQGTILNGGTQVALNRSAQDYATGEYQTLRANTMEAYRQRYSQFQDTAGMSLAARTLNGNENQNNFMNRTSRYLQGNQRTLSDYLTNLTARRNWENDYWSRLNDLNQTGAGAAGGSH
jgi:hypothetical protein